MLWLSLFILLIMNTYAVSVSWILWIKPQWAWKHISLQDQILISILLDRHKLYSPTHWLICSTKIYGVPSVCQAWTQSWIAACLTQEELEKIDTPRPAFLIVTMSAGPQSNNSMSSMERGKWEALSTPGDAGNLEQEEKAFKSNLRVQRHWWITLSPCVSVSSSVKWG